MSAAARGRPRDEGVSEAILAATLRLLGEQGFARMSMEGVAAAAGVGKPAIYRRFRDKADLAVAAINTMLVPMEAAEDEATEPALRRLFTEGLPADAPAYVALIGGLAAEHEHHPELIDAFRRQLLLPRRAVVTAAIERGQQRGDIRGDLPAETLLDMAAGPILARAFAGLDTGKAWRARAFSAWWSLVSV